MKASGPRGGEAAGDSLLVWAPAKINLYLGIHDTKDERGYHRVDSVMAALDLADTLSISPAPELQVSCDPAVDIPPEQNSVWRAATELARAFGREPAYRIDVRKRIPLRAGLGGPSTDAAAALVGLCQLWGIDPEDETVVRVARGIGADVPFFLHGALAYLDGAGDCLRERLEPQVGLPVALIKPPHTGVSAAAAYARFDEDPQPLPPLEPVLQALRADDVDALCAHIANNLGPAACSLAPAIGEVLGWLREQRGVRAALVSGSGACSFALCDTLEAARAIAYEARRSHGWWAYAATMEKRGAHVIQR